MSDGSDADPGGCAYERISVPSDQCDPVSIGSALPPTRSSCACTFQRSAVSSTPKTSAPTSLPPSVDLLPRNSRIMQPQTNGEESIELSAALKTLRTIGHDIKSVGH